jgi:hypothetical protein
MQSDQARLDEFSVHLECSAFPSHLVLSGLISRGQKNGIDTSKSFEILRLARILAQSLANREIKQKELHAFHAFNSS